MLVAFPFLYHCQRNSSTFKENYPVDDRDRVFDRCMNSIPVLYLCKCNLTNIFILAIIAFVCLSLVFFPQGNSYYYQVPMSIIGNVYANSMLLLINSRMRIISEKETSTVVSTMAFGTASINDEGLGTDIELNRST